MTRKNLIYLISLFISLIVGCTPIDHRTYNRNFAYNSNTTISPLSSFLHTNKNYEERGYASWYGSRFHKRRTSSGERYNMYKLTAAHRTLPLSSYVLVTNLVNGRHVVVKINDRGPFVSNRLIDLSYAAAKKLRMLGRGTVPVDVKVINKKFKA